MKSILFATAGAARGPVTVWRANDATGASARLRSSHARSVRHDRIRDGAGNRYVPRSRLHLAGSASDDRRSRADPPANGMGPVGVRVGVCALRSAWRLAWRPHRTPTCADADRALVVLLHCGDRLGVERGVVDRDARAFRRWRGRLLSKPHARFHNLAAGEGT